VCHDSQNHAAYVAVFNFDPDHPAARTLGFDRLGLDTARVYAVHDLWTGLDTTARTALSLVLPPGGSTIVCMRQPTLSGTKKP
jgi:hypothetical protein